MIPIMRYKKVWLTFSGILVIASVAALVLIGLNLGIDFQGGSLLEVRFEKENLETADLGLLLEEVGISGVTIQKTGEKSFFIRAPHLSQETHGQILAKFQENFGETEEKRFENIGPVIGSELKKKAVIAILIAVVFIILYLAWAFRRTSEMISSWKMGIAAVIALIHDILIISGIFVILGKYLGVSIDAYFVTALLTVLGFSVHDTIVVFDRIRENLYKSGADESFEEVVNRGVNETLIRSLNTSLTTLFVLLAAILFGGESIRYFVLALILGIIIGTYSSIFVASPVLVVWQRQGSR